MASYAETMIASTGMLRSIAGNTRDLAVVLKGFTEFMLRGKNSDDAFHAMLRLHCSTNGQSTQVLTNVFQRLYAEKRIPFDSQAASYFAALSAATQAQTAAEIRSKGYSVLPVQLSAAACDELAAFSKTTVAEAIGTKAEVISESLYDESNPRVVRFKYKPQDLVKSDVVQRLLADPVLINIVQEYFGAPALVDSVAMWWSLGKGDPASSDLAQLYHFDFDRPKWLKVFFYVSDVDQDNGPHVFVKGSHAAEERRAHLLKRGYVRIADEEIEAVYSKDAVAEITGPKGTVFLEDTSGFHKGKALIRGNRLLFEIQFCLTQFGARYEMLELPSARVPAFDALYRKHPWLYPIFRKG
jgi:hypothetical protein